MTFGEKEAKRLLENLLVEKTDNYVVFELDLSDKTQGQTYREKLGEYSLPASGGVDILPSTFNAGWHLPKAGKKLRIKVEVV